MTTSHSDTSTNGPARRRFRKRWLLYGVAILLFALLAVRLLFMRSFDKPLPSDLATVRELPVSLANGQTAVLGDVVRPGVPTVISLWASWCAPCYREAPKLAELRRQFAPDELNIVYLNVRDPYATQETLANHMARFSLPFDYVVIGDSKRLDELTHDSANLIPRTFVYDRDGQPIAAIVGYKPLALGRVAGLVAD